MRIHPALLHSVASRGIRNGRPEEIAEPEPSPLIAGRSISGVLSLKVHLLANQTPVLQGESLLVFSLALPPSDPMGLGE